ncbi:uncharacterized protein LOC134191746 [Corticium candelabrum]|uniref:uncharacterized protein LOC134191746 n=1 Tax=Corticium candelabrum TaxID=121492 RepID=UPI002E264047|nr:uncharacterized protein LOC134191746 [Corticium candelabrum]
MLSVFNRPKQLVEQKNGEDIVVNCKMNEAVYLYKCTQCRVILPDRAAKFVMDSCEDIDVQIAGGLVTGTVEILKCQRAKLVIKTGVSIPTYTLESCQDIDIALDAAASQVETIYFLNATNIRVICPSANHTISLPDGTDPSQQCVANRTSTGFTVERVVREGIGYPTTEVKKEAAEKRTKLLKKKIQEMVEESIQVTTTAKDESAQESSDTAAAKN